MENQRSILVSSVYLIIDLIIIIRPAEAAPTYLDSICPNETIFNPNSTYEINLNTLLLSLTSNASTTNFYVAQAGDKAPNDYVYGLFLCRGDLNSTSCQNCVEAATLNLQQSYCPRSKVALIWYNECMVRYSNESLLGKMEESPKLVVSNSQNLINTNLEHSRLILQDLMSDLAVQAANDESGKKFKMKGVNFTDSQAVYMIAQCTPDLTVRDCSLCLKTAINLLPVGINGRVLHPSCFVWYETSLSNSQQLPMELINSVDRSLTGEDRLSTKVILMIILPTASVLMALLALYLVIRKPIKYNVIEESDSEDYMSIEFLRYDLDTIRKATNYFSDDNKKAEGVFGCIYKGTLSDGREIAVKILSERFCQNLQDFRNEVFLHSKLQHKNLTEFIGFCLEGEQKLIINEYIPNPNLHYFLTDQERRRQLDWDMRYHIITGIARGILYIDQDSRQRVVHCNLRPGNILLDSNMNAKISHFGLALSSIIDETRIDNNPSTCIASYGNTSVDKKICREYSIQSNVFCFGVLVLSIISSERYSNLTNLYEINFAEDLLSEAWKKYREGSPLDFVDPTLRDPSSSEEVLRCMHLGLLCIQGSPDERPSMPSVVFMLNNSTIIDLPPPQEPAFFFQSDGQKTDEASTTPSTINNISISELQAR